MRVAVLGDIHQAWDRTPCAAPAGRRRSDLHRALAIHPRWGFDALIITVNGRFTRVAESATRRRISRDQRPAAHRLRRGASVESSSPKRGRFSTGAAELAIGLAIAAMQGIPGNDAAISAGMAGADDAGPARQTLGIIGLGESVNMSRGWHRVRHASWLESRLTDAAAAAVGAERRDSTTCCAKPMSSIHASLTKDSNLLDAQRIGLMKATAYLVNTARGPIVDEAALVGALEEANCRGRTRRLRSRTTPGHLTDSRTSS